LKIGVAERPSLERPLLQAAVMNCVRVGSLVLLSVLGASSSALAQTEGKFAVGAQLSTRTATGTDTSGTIGVSLLWRIGQAKSGWGWQYGLNWFSTDVDRSIGGSNTELGELKVRPILGGYGYTHVVGRTAITGKVMGGYAFASMRLTPAATDAYHDRVGARSVTADASNTIVVMPEVSAWYDINSKMGLRVSTGYIVARPNITVRSTAGEDKRRVHADMVTFRVGMVYSIF
jgi:hypothetical protein